MYIVKRPFRNYGQVITVGSVISEPTKIKRFNSKLSEGNIIYVKDEEVAKAKKFFKEKYGVDIPDNKEEAAKPKATVKVATKTAAKA